MEQLLHDTLESCQEYIPKLIEAAGEVAYNFHSNSESEALGWLPQILEGLQWVVDAIQGIQRCYNILAINIEELTAIFKELEQALECRDYVLTGDLLDYEIKPVLEKWLDEINNCCNGIKQ